MPQIRKEGKDTIIFRTKKDDESISKMNLPKPDSNPGLVLPNGDINWGCPCLGGMATGPCGLEFREAFSCYHYSKDDPKGANCYEAFKTMQACMVQYPNLYANKNDLTDLDDDDDIHGQGEPESKRELETSKMASKVKHESDVGVTSPGKELTNAKA